MSYIYSRSSSTSLLVSLAFIASLLYASSVCLIWNIDNDDCRRTYHLPSEGIARRLLLVETKRFTLNPSTDTYAWSCEIDISTHPLTLTHTNKQLEQQTATHRIYFVAISGIFVGPREKQLIFRLKCHIVCARRASTVEKKTTTSNLSNDINSTWQ